MYSCHVCSEKALVLFHEYAQFKRVTSDAKPWPEGGTLGRCTSCGCIQARIDETWRREISEIYRDYTTFFQSDGAEQKIFEAGAAPVARSELLTENLVKSTKLPSKGRLLDIGCGNGYFLASASRALPGWTFSGLEWDNKHAERVLQIPRIEDHYVGSLENVPGKFDAISMLHVLEHLESPIEFLEKAREKIVPGGLLFIQLPYYVESPFELFVADHSSHFDCPSIRRLVSSAGFQIELLDTKWVTKEISLVARNQESQKHGGEDPEISPSVPAILEWLGGVVEQARTTATGSRSFGLFGTAIASTWLYSELTEHVEFFVDEDTNRVGKTILGRPVFSPAQVPVDSDVYVGLAPELSRRIVKRLNSENVRYHAVPTLSPVSSRHAV